MVSNYVYNISIPHCFFTVKKTIAVALNSTEALMSGFLKSDIPHHQLGYGGPHPHHSHSHHGSLPPGMPMAMTPFGLPHGLDAVGFGQGMWGKY